MRRLISRLDLTIKRGASNGYYENGEWVEPTTTTSIHIKCSIQPFGTANENRLNLPTGFMASDAQVVFTKTQLKTVSQFSIEEADTTTIDGLEYVAVSVDNWSRHSVRSAHYQVLFARRDLDPKGKL